MQVIINGKGEEKDHNIPNNSDYYRSIFLVQGINDDMLKFENPEIILSREYGVTKI